MPEMTPLQNNPPQSLAQPMRQAYDYWQEVPCHKRKKLFAAKLSTTQERICKAPCAWRVPPPSRGSSPLLPVCKSYQRRKKRPLRGVYPPTRGTFPLLPVCKSYQQCARPLSGPSSEVLGYIYLLIKGSTAPEPPLAVGRQVIACLFYCSPGICPQRGSHPTFGWGDTSAA